MTVRPDLLPDYPRVCNLVVSIHLNANERVTKKGRRTDTIAKHTPNPPALRAVAFEMSKLLDCGLDKEGLAVLIALCENGVNPEALAAVVKELRREAAALNVRLPSVSLPQISPNKHLSV